MHLVVGLGNPGKKYELTRHNAGFLAVDMLAARLGVKIEKIKFGSLIGEAAFEESKLILMKPQTFMNLSGEAVRSAVEYYKIPVENVVVVYDDIDISVGSLRVRAKGSAGTHNGMRNILYHLETENFPRVRIGIGGDKHGAELYEYVLARFAKDEEQPLYDSLKRAADAVLCIVRSGVDAAMNQYNGGKNEKDK